MVLLSGGVGKRMRATIPKQYLELNGHPIATWSMRTFASMPEVGEIVVVCAPEVRCDACTRDEVGGGGNGCEVYNTLGLGLGLGCEVYNTT